MPSSPFCFGYFWDRVSHLCLANLDCNPIYTFYIAVMTDSGHHAQLFAGWDGISHTVCPGWSQTMIPTISASQVARIAGVGHCAQPVLQFLLMILPTLGNKFCFKSFNATHNS
jgi:hypothetical protein